MKSESYEIKIEKQVMYENLKTWFKEEPKGEVLLAEGGEKKKI